MLIRESYQPGNCSFNADVALAWHGAKGVTAPIVGCSRPSRVDDAVRALELTLSAEDTAYLEESYLPHELVGPIGRTGEKALAGTTLIDDADKR